MTSPGTRKRGVRKFLCWAGFHQRLKTTYPWGQDYYCTYCGHKGTP